MTDARNIPAPSNNIISGFLIVNFFRPSSSPYQISASQSPPAALHFTSIHSHLTTAYPLATYSYSSFTLDIFITPPWGHLTTLSTAHQAHVGVNCSSASLPTRVGCGVPWRWCRHQFSSASSASTLQMNSSRLLVQPIHSHCTVHPCLFTNSGSFQNIDSGVAFFFPTQHKINNTCVKNVCTH